MSATRHVLVAGGSGYIGRAVVAALLARGDRVTVASRTGKRVGGAASCTYDALPAAVDAVVNLAGASIAGRRWTKAYERELWTSRVDFTHALVAQLQARGTSPEVFVNASAVGIYGDAGEATLDEDAPLGSGFLADLCRAWEAAAATAAALAARVVVLRFGVVLSRDGGALATMTRPFRWFVGGPIGRGRFYVPWIHRRDLVRLLLWVLDDASCRGTYNATAKVPCTNAELSRSLAAVLRRPCLLPVPPLALRVLLGRAGPYLTQSQRVLPARALAAGFTFEHERCETALEEEFEPRRG